VETIGDPDAGFSVQYDAEVGVVRVVGWGFWSIEVSVRFDEAVRTACGSAPAGTRVLMDMTHLKPLRDEGQRAFGAAVEALKRLGNTELSVVTTSHLTKLQLMRLAKEAGALDSTQFI
jgi:hypothetical protein